MSIFRFYLRKCRTQVIIIRDLELNIVNEEEMRQMKLIKQGILDRFTHEDIPIGVILKSLASDYSYVLTGKNEEGEYLFKIPSEVKNEFENNYTIDDLLMGKVTLIGIYKGEKKIEDLTSTFNGTIVITNPIELIGIRFKIVLPIKNDVVTSVF